MELDDIIGVLILSVMIIILSVGSINSIINRRYKDSFIFASLAAVFSIVIYGIAKNLDTNSFTITMDGDKQMTFGRDKSFTYRTKDSRLRIN
jgi:hypothetical protein